MIIYAAHYDYGSVSKDNYLQTKDEWLDAYKRCSQWQTKYERADGIKKQEFLDSTHYWLKISDSLSSQYRAIEYNIKEREAVIIIETETGNILWHKEAWKYSLTGKGEDIVSPSYISDDGKVSVSVPGPHFISSAIFYNEKGDISGQIGSLNSISGYTDLSADGKRFCAYSISSTSNCVF